MLKAQWREFRHGRPGHRFEDRFERNKTSRAERSGATRFIKPAAGIVLLVAGIVFCLIPGPGIPLLVAGGGLLADVSRPVARAMDGAEVRVRALASWGRRKWELASTAVKCALAVLMVSAAGAAAYAGFLVATG